jgi:O-antigen ligase
MKFPFLLPVTANFEHGYTLQLKNPAITYKDPLTYLGMMLIVLGLPLSRAMMSIGMILLVVVALLQNDIPGKLKRFYSITPFIAIQAFFLLIIISFFWSEDKSFWLDRTRIRLPFLFMPFAFFVLLPVERKAYLIILKTYFWLIFLCCVWSMFHLFTDFKNVLQSYSQGNVLFTPVNHIRFSMMAVMAVVIGGDLLTEKYGDVWKKGIIVAAMAVIIAYIHFLAVRSGLLALYAVAFVLLVKYIIQSRKLWIGVVAIIGIIIVGFLGCQFVPTIQNKVGYMRYDLENYFQGNYNVEGSDTKRMLSIRAGIEAGNESPFLGQGYGDIKIAVNKVFAEKFSNVPDGNREMPHNQFVFIYAGLGAVGLILFLWSFFSPLFYKRNLNNTIILSISVIMFTSFLSEYTLDNQIGVAFYLFFLLSAFCQELKPVSKLKAA